ncbi:DICT sensory domain-containing protein [Halorientalis salina]|uniref:DICT sensory domain-containing protein n=1 Tax=Halorientalis salina TaxID=2932266 RepID=UPI0010AC95E0|nr:DICT sensory domain-containing protein [Halorientalis salina]
MSLSELIAGVENHEKTLTVFNADESVTAELRDQFADRNVTVESESTPSGKPGEFVTISEDGEVLTATSIADLKSMLADEDAAIGLSESPYRSLLEYLDETMFTSWSIDQMVAASREIEDRAWRVGEGEIHAGFQYLSTLRGELPVYERLGSKRLDVHAYAVPDEDPPKNRGFTLHIERAEEIERSWFVVFDGGESAMARAPDDGEAESHPGRSGGHRSDTGDRNAADDNKCALLAEERAPREFYGFWTYDPDTVDWILDYLDSTYGVVEQ